MNALSWYIAPRYNGTPLYRKFHCGDKRISRSSCLLHNGNSYTGKTASLYWSSLQNISRQGTDLLYWAITVYDNMRWLKADSWLAPSQWETVSHWLGANQGSALGLTWFAESPWRLTECRRPADGILTGLPRTLPAAKSAPPGHVVNKETLANY